MPAVLDKPQSPLTHQKFSRYAEANAKAKADGTMVVFEHPRNFAEFYEREPRFVERWLRSKRCPADLLEDYEHDMLLFLMKPVTSKRTGSPITYPDKITYYQPELMGNHRTRWAFAHHIIRLLLTAYPKAIKAWNRSKVSGPKVVTFGPDFDTLLAMHTRHKVPCVTVADGDVIITPMLSVGDRKLFSQDPADTTTTIMVDKFFSYLEQVAPAELLHYARLLREFDSPQEIMDTLGCNRDRCKYLRGRLTMWMQAYTQFNQE